MNNTKKNLEIQDTEESVSPLKEERKTLMLKRIKSYGSANFIIYWIFVVGAGIGGLKDFLITKTTDVIFLSMYIFTVIFWGIFFCFYYLGPAFRYRRLKKLIERNEIDEIKDDACKTYMFTETKKNMSIAALIELEEISPFEIDSFLKTYHDDDGSSYFPHIVQTRSLTITKYLKTVSIMWDIDKKYSMFDILLALYLFGIFMLGYEQFDIFFICLWVFLGFIGIILLIVFGGIFVNLIVFSRINSLAKKSEITKLRLIADEAWFIGWKALYAKAALKDLAVEDFNE